VDRPQCMPLSALGVILHKFPETALQIAKKDTRDALFLALQNAFEARVKGALYFNPEGLSSVGFKEKVWTPFELGVDLQDYDFFKQKLDALLTQIQNQKPERHTAFILKLLPEDTSPGTSFHTITVTCDGLWDHAKSFGIQETVYSKSDKGVPSRYSRTFEDQNSFSKALHDFIIGRSLEYSVYRLQAHTMEKLPKPMIRSLLQGFFGFRGSE